MRIYRALCLTLFFAPLLSADFEVTAWKFEAPIRLPEQLNSPQFVRLTLPGWVLANAGENLWDLRVINASGTEIPYLLQRAETRTFQVSLATTIINRGVDPGRFEQFVCDLGSTTQTTNEIVLYTEAQNFVRKTDIAGSADGQSWIILRSNAYIFDQQEQGRHLRNLLVSYPDSSYRYLKVVVWFDGGPPLNLTGAEVRRQEKAEFEPEIVRPATLRQSEDPERKATDVFVGTEMGKQHFEGCLLGIREKNFERSVDVSYQDYRGAWVNVGSGSIHRFTIGPALDENLIVPVHDLNQKQFRIRIWNYDSPPLSVESVTLRRMPRILIFNASPGERYRLFFANPEGGRARLRPRRGAGEVGGAKASPSFSSAYEAERVLFAPTPRETVDRAPSGAHLGGLGRRGVATGRDVVQNGSEYGPRISRCTARAHLVLPPIGPII